eukprot:Opistho-1_new@87923
MSQHVKFFGFAAAAQVLFIIFYGIFTEYAPELDGHNQSDTIGLTYPFFQDVHVMILVGFGFLMTFLRRYGFSAVGFNFLISACIIQWSMFTLGFFHQLLSENGNHFHRIHLNVETLIESDFAAASCLIAFGALLGKTSPLQLLAIAMIQCVFYALNEAICYEKYKLADIGGSLTIHTFGAYYGLTVSMLTADRATRGHKDNRSSYHGDIFAMIGTLFLWMYWPSFNGALATGPQQHRVVVNTVISLCACCVVAFACTTVLRPSKKFEMVDIQNATLAGGVAVGAVADMYIRPFGAALVGASAGVVSSVGFALLMPLLDRKLKLQDTCGVNNLHGMPGLIGGFASVIAAGTATLGVYGTSLFVVFPARDPAGRDWDAQQQALMQLASIGTTLALALAGACVASLVIRLPFFGRVHAERAFADDLHWETPHEDEHEPAASGYDPRDLEMKEKAKIGDVEACSTSSSTEQR